jgi:integrase
MRHELTDAFIRALKPPALGRVEVWDSKQPLLLLRVTATGVASWSVRTRTADGKRTRPGLGRWPQMGIAAARKAARAVLTEIEKGSDPVADRRAAEANRQARLNAPTVKQRLAEWQDARQPYWSNVYAGDVARFCNNEIIPVLGARVLTETQREDWTALVSRKRKQSASSAANLYRIASSFLNHAEAAGWIAHALLPRKGASLLAPPVAARARTLTDAELVAIWRAADGMPPKPRAFIHLLVMTAARRQEVADIATGEVDLDCGLWSIPATRTKNGLGIAVPLHPLVIAELRVIWPAHECGPNWKLLGAIVGSGLSGFSKVKARVDAACGVPEWHVHDLRRSARTGMARLGISSEHAEAALNHVSGRSALARVYDRHDYRSEIIAALSRWQAHIASLLESRSSATEVVSFRVSA